jgi:ubiquinone/menaquinone biosynthesis C-methylase UbiE
MNKEPRDINSNNNTSSTEYDNISRYYDPLFNIISLGKIPKVKKWIIEKINTGDQILEIGCGSGWLTCQCAMKGATVVALDTSDKMLDLAKKRAKKKAVYENIQFINMDFQNQFNRSILKTPFDKIIFCFFLDIFTDDRMVFQLIKNVQYLLKDHGQVIIADELIIENPVAQKLVDLIRFPVFKFLELTTGATYPEMHDYIKLLKKSDYEEIDIKKSLFGYLGVLTASQKKNYS